MIQQIPAPLISVISDIVAHAETHPSLHSLFMHAEAYGDAPEGSKPTKAQAWLRSTNKHHPNPLSVAGHIICTYMEDPEMDKDFKVSEWVMERELVSKKRDMVRRIEAVLLRCGLKYHMGGILTTGGMAPSKTLGELIKGRDLPAIHREFERAIEAVETKPRDAVSAAANILESVFKIYIEDNRLPMPDKQDLQQVFKVVRADLGMDAGSVGDEDLKRIISGLFSVVDGIGALRTHASSAHSEGRKGYKLEPRHARLAVNAAHTLVTFVMETWDKRAAIKAKHLSA